MPSPDEPKRRSRRPVEISGEAARQGRIVLDTPARRALFVGGLIGLVVLAVLLALLG